VLPEATTEAVLTKLGLDHRPDADAAGLATVYAAWCERVPFDNLVKRIHLVTGSLEPFPNGTAEAFFALYRKHGTGGTCWPSSNALHALLVSLGFETRRASGAMRDDRYGPIHTHATEIVTLDSHEYWVDTSMLTHVPLPLRQGTVTQIERDHDPVRAEPVGDLWRVWWELPSNGEPIACLLLDDSVGEPHYLARYEASRELSGFNDAIYATRVTASGKVNISKGVLYERTAAGITQRDMGDDRTDILVEEFGYSPEIIARLPPDSPVS
jgi:N-hydroxyarylamine O-acetyltransferase